MREAKDNEEVLVHYLETEAQGPGVLEFKKVGPFIIFRFRLVINGYFILLYSNRTVFFFATVPEHVFH